MHGRAVRAQKRKSPREAGFWSVWYRGRDLNPQGREAGGF